METQNNEAVDVVVGDDNVFADLGRRHPGERQVKASLAIVIERLIEENGLTQTDAAQRMGLTQPDISLIVRGRLKGFTLERLLQGLLALDQDVDIVVRPKRLAAERAHVHVARALAGV